MLENCNNGSELFLYADDAKLFRHISCINDVDLLQKDFLDVQLWMEKWLLKLNINKCKVVSYGHQIGFINDYYLHSSGSISVQKHLDSMKDLSVTFDSKLKCDRHINKTLIKLTQFWVLYVQISNICRLEHLLRYIRLSKISSGIC